MIKPNIVVTEWKVNNEPVDDLGNYVHIIGRRRGLIAFILSLMRIEPKVHLEISGERIKVSAATIFGSGTRVLPLENCCSTFYGYRKPFFAALLLSFFISFILAGPMFFIPGIGPVVAGLLFILGPILGVIYYILNKSIYLEFVEMSGIVTGIAYRGSMIEGVVVDEESAAYICTLTQALIDERVTARAVVTPPTN